MDIDQWLDGIDIEDIIPAIVLGVAYHRQTGYEGGGKKYPTIFSETKIRALALLHH